MKILLLIPAFTLLSCGYEEPSFYSLYDSRIYIHDGAATPTKAYTDCVIKRFVDHFPHWARRDRIEAIEDAEIHLMPPPVFSAPHPNGEPNVVDGTSKGNQKHYTIRYDEARMFFSTNSLYHEFAHGVYDVVDTQDIIVELKDGRYIQKHIGDAWGKLGDANEKIYTECEVPMLNEGGTQALWHWIPRPVSPVGQSSSVDVPAFYHGPAQSN